MMLDDPQDDDCAKVLEALMQPLATEWAKQMDKQVLNALTYGVSFIYPWGSNPADSEPTMRKPMKPGPYKSSTHGPINVSMKARELLLTNQLAAQKAIADGEYSTDLKALSHSRGEIAKYISDLEFTAEKFTRGIIHTRPKTATEMLGENSASPSHLDAIRAATDRNMASLRKSTFENFLKNPPIYLRTGFDESSDFNPARYKKETAMTNTETPRKDPAPKTRSQLIGEATHELCDAQRKLERLQSGPQGKPSNLTICTPVGGYLDYAVSDLVLEQWATLAEKAVARAKARVAKAEKAVAALLA